MLTFLLFIYYLLVCLFVYWERSYCVNLAGLAVYVQTRLAPTSQRSTGLCLLGAGTKGMYHHAQHARFHLSDTHTTDYTVCTVIPVTSLAANQILSSSVLITVLNCLNFTEEQRH